MYTLLSAKLQSQMTALKLLEERLNTVRVKALLQWEFTVIYCEFNKIFHNISDLWRDKYLTFLVQWCNYNRRRWEKNKRISTKIERQISSSFFKISQSFNISLFSFTDNKKSELLKSVWNIMIQVHQDMNHSTFCRSQNLLVRKRLEDIESIER